MGVTARSAVRRAASERFHQTMKHKTGGFKKMVFAKRRSEDKLGIRKHIENGCAGTPSTP